MKAVFACIVLLLCGIVPGRAAQPPVVLVPWDDRPVTRQLPQMLGRIAGRDVIVPPRPLLGNYLTFGKPDEIIKWLNGPQARRASVFVISTDMLAYGGLVASRVPGTTYQDAYFRVRTIERLRDAHPHAWIGAFGTVMRLAPTGIPNTGAAASFFAPYPLWSYLQEYANLHDPPLRSEAARAETLRGLAGDTLDAYIATRARNYAVDSYILQLAQNDAIDRVVLGQDDAGPVGLHVREVRALQQTASTPRLQEAAAIEPGADELGMAMVAQALARGIAWTPHVAVRYSMPRGENTNDPLEFAPISVAIDGLIRLCGGVHDDARPDIVLFVRVPNTTQAGDDALANAMTQAAESGSSVAFADLTFLTNSFTPQAVFAERLLSSGLASRLDAYSSWNTNANTVGTAVAEAVAANVGRRTGSYNVVAHREFTFNRILDDYAFHVYVRPEINAMLDKQGISDHTYLLPDQAAPIEAYARDALWSHASAILPQL
ncbi:MAG: DUF4127 family protein, partial [Candidatus Eremiobacteraeota bacterium]|nr:DUF4127 family protein [Candidatus Eremiobacteraeota bacterium]